MIERPYLRRWDISLHFTTAVGSRNGVTHRLAGSGQP